jgi:3-hydroxyisobutyrate dehydrogenase-like beta-hydroxyacid dehydrogenase
VYDLLSQVAEKFRGKAVIASSPEELFRVSEVTFLSLPGYPDVEAMTERFLALGVKGKAVIDLSTSYPPSSKAIQAKFKEAEGVFLDAPLTGSPVHAMEGTLVVNVGGDEADYEKYKNVIGAFSKASHYIGLAGAGNIAKLMNNYLAIMYTALYSECFPLAEKMGFDVKRLFEIISDSGVNCPIYQRTIPKMCITKTFDPGFSINFCIKDLSYFKKLFDEYKCPSLILDGGLNTFKLTAVMGCGEGDSSNVGRFAYHNLGIKLDN